LKEVMGMQRKVSKLVAVMLALVIAMGFLSCAASPALAQGEEQQEGPDRDVPPELQEKMRELRDTLADLRESAVPLKADMKEFRASMRKLMRKARRLPRDARWDLLGQLSALRDEYLGTVKEKAAVIRESAGATRGAVAAAREAWEAGDLEGALSALDQAIAKAPELKGQLDELHQLFEEVLEALKQLGVEGGLRLHLAPGMGRLKGGSRP
jgi:uncharacterized membrane protein YccC